jgi:hypothetical protein
MLGTNTITSYEDDSTEAKVMRVHYDNARDSLLEAHDWSFARKLFKPSKLAAEPSWGWANAFAIPHDIRRVTGVWDRDDTGFSRSNYTTGQPPEQVTYEINSGNILTNADTLYCKGIRDIDDEGIYPALFIQAFAAQMAVLGCYAITESNSKLQAMQALATQYLRDAVSRDAVQGRNKKLTNRSLRNSRVNGGAW